MAPADVLPLGGFYQFGYVTRSLDAAVETLRTQFGIVRFRRKRSAPYMESLHAWAGPSQIEVLELTDAAPQMYLDYIPDQPGHLRLQHIGRRIDTEDQWDALERAVERLGLATPLRASVMDGQLRALYVDTRELLGIYSEYVYFAGDARGIYDDVPHNDPPAGPDHGAARA